MVDRAPPTEPVVAARGPTLRRFQGASLVALIAASVGVGTGLAYGVLQLQQWWERRAFAETQMELALQTAPADGAVRLQPGTLHGPAQGLGGPATLTLPPGRPMIVNVWLQGCQDCMPAFAAWRDNVDRIPLGFPVANVAYGQADVDWARSYRVADNLVFDEGSAIVKPLGIGSFVTLVVDADGVVVFRDRPDGPDFFARMTGAIAALNGRARTTLGQGEVFAPFRAAEPTLKGCLTPSKDRFADVDRVLLKLRIDPDGQARRESVVVDGVAPESLQCFRDTIALMRWPTFSGAGLAVEIPFSVKRREP